MKEVHTRIISVKQGLHKIPASLHIKSALGPVIFKVMRTLGRIFSIPSCLYFLCFMVEKLYSYSLLRIRCVKARVASCYSNCFKREGIKKLVSAAIKFD